MRKESRKILCIALCAIAFGFLPQKAQSENAETELFSRIKSLSEAGESKKVMMLGNEFHKKYPSSLKRGEVYFIMAEHASSPDVSLKLYREASLRLKGNRGLDARLEACRILLLASRWKELEEEARSAVSLANDESRKADFMLHLARAYISEEEYEKCADLCEKVIKISDRPSHVLPSLLLLSHTERKTTGYSRGYFSILRDIISGFHQSENACSALYLLGRAYHERGDYDRAYSVYREVTRRFPRSPEASFASAKVATLEGHHPKIVGFLPDESFLKSLDKIDLGTYAFSEEDRIPKKSYYAIMLGPVEEKSDAQKIARSINNEFAPIKIVHSSRGYAVYAGRLHDTRSASTMKIRLAEEMGYNGKIVRLRIDDNKTYIYGE